MAYFGECKGTQTPDERRLEADRILKIFEECGVDSSCMNDREGEFITKMGDPDATVSPKQLLYLRDLKSKYAE
jgi:hypothetical protein